MTLYQSFATNFAAEILVLEIRMSYRFKIVGANQVSDSNYDLLKLKSAISRERRRTVIGSTYLPVGPLVWG